MSHLNLLQIFCWLVAPVLDAKTSKMKSGLQKIVLNIKGKKKADSETKWRENDGRISILLQETIFPEKNKILEGKPRPKLKHFAASNKYMKQGSQIQFHFVPHKDHECPQGAVVAKCIETH